MDPKSTVVKSKSSNSAISKKSEEGSRRQYNKKTRSNADFPSHGLKKRGVYVEKRLTKTNLMNNGKEVECIATKPPPRPRPGQKRFLASVLTILSKSTTGTQCPDLEEDKRQRKGRVRDKNKAKSKQTNPIDVDSKENYSFIAKDTYKSRILNKKFVREDKKKMVVLQSKKEIAQTPSNYSEWSYKDASQNSNFSNLMINEDSNNGGGLNIADELKNAVLEGRNPKVKKLRYLDDEPKTLVSDGVKGQKNLYNFFVDLLETTISVYNVNAEYDAAGPREVSKTNLQINESVANKLNIGKAKKAVEFDGGIVSPETHKYVRNDTESERVGRNSKPLTIPFKSEVPVKTPKVKKIKHDSFIYTKSVKPLPQKSKSLEIGRKTTFRNKNDLIKALKEELEVNTTTFEEPRSIFQALRIMARNKKKITFDHSLDHKFFTDECVLKRRNVISSRRFKKAVKNNKNITDNNAVNSVRSMFKNKNYAENTRQLYTDKIEEPHIDTDNIESYHSLEVYGFDYEPQLPKKLYLNRAKEVTVTYHSSNSDIDFDVNDAILNPSTFSSIRKFSAVVD